MARKAQERSEGLVSLAEMRAAARLLASVAVRTPLVPVPRLRRGLLVKPESLQPTGSFKLRGAYTAIRASGRQAQERGVVAHSSGNHGHAVAYAAALLGVHAVVVVPSTAPKVKTDAIEYYGAELVTVAPTLAARVAATEASRREASVISARLTRPVLTPSGCIPGRSAPGWFGRDFSAIPSFTLCTFSLSLPHVLPSVVFQLLTG